jgi:hypothetical protein
MAATGTIIFTVAAEALSGAPQCGHTGRAARASALRARLAALLQVRQYRRARWPGGA